MWLTTNLKWMLLLLATPWSAAYQVPPSMGFSRQKYWCGLPLPSPKWMLATNSFGTFIKQVCCILSQPTLKRKECLLGRKPIILRLKGVGRRGIKRLTPGTFNVLRLQFIIKNNFFLFLYTIFQKHVCSWSLQTIWDIPYTSKNARRGIIWTQVSLQSSIKEKISFV